MLFLDDYPYMHVLGGVYGQVLGNAWGMPAYFRPDQTWTYYNGWIDRLLPAPPNHPTHAGLQAGQVTENTQQMMTLAQTIISEGQITVESAARAIVAWYDQIDGDNSPYIGPTTRRAVIALKSGTNPYLTGFEGDTNGGAMRISPIGLIHPGNPDAAVQDAIITCTPTHLTDVAVSGAGAVAAAVAQAMVPHTTLEDIINAGIHGAEMSLSQGSPWFGASVARKIDFAIQLATNNSFSEQERLQDLYDLIGSTFAAADTVPCAFGVLAMADGNPIKTAIYAANLSGDAGTVGAIACAIAGTWRGIESIPIGYIEVLRENNLQYDFEAIAKGLYEIAQRNLSDSSQSTEMGQALLE